MLTGQNTEVRHDGLSFHVQTEDKGWSNPYVESLVYLGGQVLDSRRTGYGDLQGEPEADKALARLMESQHQEMIDAVLAGDLDARVEELRGSSSEASGVQHESVDLSQFDWESSAGLQALDARDQTALAESGELDEFSNQTFAGTAAADPVVPGTLSPGTAAESRPSESASSAESTALAESTASEHETIVASSTLDEAVLDYLIQRQRGDTLKLGLSSDVDLLGGRDAQLSLTAASSLAGRAVECEIEIKIVFSTQPARVLTRSRTDAAGEARIALQIPAISEGSAALIITGRSELGSAQLKYLL